MIGGLISYSEATRYTEAKRLETEAWCRKNDKPMPKHLLYPRTRGFVASVQKLRDAKQVKAVYDVTVAYANKDRGFQQPPTFAQSLMIPTLDAEWTFFVHVERHMLDELPQDEAGLIQWLEKRWIEKGEMLELLLDRLEKGQPWVPL